MIFGGLLAAIAIGVLVPLASGSTAGVAVIGSVVVGVLFVGMLAVRAAVPPGRVRLGILAGLMVAIAAAGLISVLIVAAAAA